MAFKGFWRPDLFTSIEFTTKGDIITLRGIRAAGFYADLKRLWKSSRPVNYIAGDNLGSSYIRFQTFYVHDVYYILTQMAQNHRKLRLETNLRYLNTAIKEMEETILADYFKEHPSLYGNPEGFKIFNKKPYGKQVEFFKTYSDMKQKMNLRGYLLDAEPGTGKTATSLMLMNMIDTSGVIVVGPIKAMHRAWEKTIVEELTEDKTYWLSTSGKPLKPGYDYYICHNEYMRKAAAEFQAAGVTARKIIVDECHNFNELGSDQTQGLISLCVYTNAQDILFMSGTPFKAMGKEVATLLSCIDDSFTKDIGANISKTFGRNSKGWIEIIANRIGLTSFKISASVKGDKPIYADIKVVLKDSKRFTLDAVRADIKEFVQERVSYYTKHGKEYQDFFWATLEELRPKLNPDSLREYIAGVKRLQAEGYDNRVHAELGTWLNGYEKKVILPLLKGETKERFKDAKTVVKYVSLKIQGEALGRILGKRRIECFVEIAKTINYRAMIDQVEKKTVIFATHVASTEEAYKRCKELGYNPAIVHGQHTKEMPNIVKAFFDDPKLNPLIATYDSLSEAVPLYCANHVALINPPFRDYEERQAVSRADRLGQDTQVYVSKFILDTGKEENLSSRTLDILKWSKEQVAILTGQPLSSEEYNLESADLFVRRLHSSSPEAEMMHHAQLIADKIDRTYSPAQRRW